MAADFDLRYLNYILPLSDDIFPVHATHSLIGISRVFSMILKVLCKYWPEAGRDGGDQWSIIWNTEDPIEHISKIVEPFPDGTNCIPETLAVAEGCPDRRVPYHPSNRRNVFMIEKLLDDDISICVADVYNNPDYDWSTPYKVGAELRNSPPNEGLVSLKTIAEVDGVEEEGDRWKDGRYRPFD